MPEVFSEGNFLARLLPHLESGPDVLVGPGDDCAVIDVNGVKQVIAVDQVIEGRHYLSETLPELVGRKLLARNLSDLAAMGATPKYALLASASSRGKDPEWLYSFHEGLLNLAKEFGVILIGGDLAQTNDESVASLTIIGELSGSAVLRSGGRSKDLLFATGLFGNSFSSEHHLNFIPRVKEGLWLKDFGVSAMMDVTDGLLKDAAKLALASKLNLTIDEKVIPLRSRADLRGALTDGEDYELIFTVSPEKQNDLVDSWPFTTPLTCIGELIDQNSLQGPVNTSGESLEELYGKGYDHFE